MIDDTPIKDDILWSCPFIDEILSTLDKYLFLSNGKKRLTINVCDTGLIKFNLEKARVVNMQLRALCQRNGLSDKAEDVVGKAEEQIRLCIDYRERYTKALSRINSTVKCKYPQAAADIKDILDAYDIETA